MRHAFAPGQVYRSDGPGEWVVEAVFQGPACIGTALERTTEGVVHMRNVDLGYRLITGVDDPRLEQLTRI